MTKIYFLINSLGGGGAENVLIRLKDFIKPYKIFLLEKEIKYQIENYLIEHISNHTKKTNPLIKTFSIPFYALNLSKKITKNDIVLSFLWRANFVNCFLKFIINHKAIISIHNDPLSSFKGLKKLNKLLIKILYKKADKIVAVSKGVAENLKKLGIYTNKIKVIYNPISIKDIEEKLKEEIDEIFINKDFIINIGRLTKQKGQWYLLRIFKEIKKEFPELKLLILGEGELKNYLVELSKNLGFKTFVWDQDKISEKFDVFFLGFQDNPFKFISKAKLFILSSLWEGFPNVIIETLACGTPIIASDCKSGPREILAPDTGFKFQTKEPEFAQYGILMPVFDGQLKKINDPLTKEEKIWIDTLLKVLKNDDILNKYKLKCKERTKDFYIENIIKDWNDLFNEFK
jgi:glycosyltransferase involved in cell wall biosynthesis